MTTSQKLNFISEYRQAVTDLIEAADKLTNLRATYDALDVGNQLTDDDFVGEHTGILKDHLTNCVAVVNGILDGVTGGPKTVIYRLMN